MCEDSMSAEFELGGKKFHCPTEALIYVISGKWRAIILYHLFQSNVLRYSDLKKKIGTISAKMLIQELKVLESCGVVERKMYPVVPPKVEYSLTKRGLAICPVFKSMEAWGEKLKKKEI